MQHGSIRGMPEFQNRYWWCLGCVTVIFRYFRRIVKIMAQEREVLEVDVLFVGAGPASLAGAIHLANLLAKQGKQDLNIAVIEKGKEMGAHGISGAVMDPKALAELIPDFVEQGAPLESPATE